MIPSPVGYIRAFVCHERNAIQGMVTYCISPNAEYPPSTFSILVHHLAKAIPAVTAAFVHALTWGHNAMSSRWALQSGKASHGKQV